ncbi:radical SAM protein [archaeon]|jgi:DNA repair photolyase|nr:radical SAM protein [archaeon]
MIIKEIQCKACMVKSKLTDYVINPYTGCQHGCIYCYADFMRRFQNIKEKWGAFIFPKVNCVDFLEKELGKNKPGNIFMSSVCDCYTPIESKFKLTRKVFETMVNSEFGKKFTIEILTKSKLVRRDFDLIKQLRVELGLSINSLDEKFSKIIEPGASLPRERIETLKLAKKEGIKIYGFISPVTIFTDLEKIFKELKEVGCEYVWVEILNIKGSVRKRMLPVIEKEFPSRYEEFVGMIEDYEGFCSKIRREAGELEKKYGLKVRKIVVH